MPGWAAQTLLFVLGLVFLMRLDVLRLRVRTQILKSADPDCELYRRNLPRKSTRWGADNEVVDQWSKRVSGVWWLGRAAFCLLAGAAIGAMNYRLFHGRDHAPGILGAAPALAVYAFMLGGALRQAKADLAEVQLQSRK